MPVRLAPLRSSIRCPPVPKLALDRCVAPANRFVSAEIGSTMACNGSGASEYAQNYRAWPLPQRIHARALPEAKKSEAPFVDVTTHKTDYAPKKIQSKIKPTMTEGAAPKPFSSHYADCVSEYALRFQPKPTQPRIRPIRPDVNGGCTVPFEGISTQRADFQKWPLKPRVHAKPTETRKDSECCPFTETSTYALSFWDKSKCVPAKVRANPPPPSCMVPFEGESVMHSDYVTKPISPKIRPPPPPISRYLDHAGPFRGETASAHEFKGWESPPKMAVLNPGKCGAKFSGDTTYNAEFKKRELPRRFAAPPRPHSSLG